MFISVHVRKNAKQQSIELRQLLRAVEAMLVRMKKLDDLNI